LEHLHFNLPFFKIASWAENIQPTIMQKMLESSANPNITSFALGLPDPFLFPIEEYQTSIHNVLNSDPKTLQYCPPISSLKQQIVKLMSTRNVVCSESQVFLTTGAQQGVSLLVRLLLDNDGSTVITESLTYPGLFQIVAPYSPEIITFPNNLKNGICFVSLEKILQNQRNKASFIYVIPEGHNPLGTSLTTEQKKKLAALARLYQVPIIEDDPYGFLCYDKPTAPVYTYDPEWIFYVGTFSKILSPSLRAGWLIVPEAIIPRLSFIKEASDINTTTFTQRIIEDFLKRELWQVHVNKLRQVYKYRRDVMLQAISQYFPKGIVISEVKHGFFIWVEFPKTINTLTLFNKALEENIAFMPGQAFSYDLELNMHNGIRLNFSLSEPDIIRSGIRTLGRLINNELKVAIHSLTNSIKKK
jgi:2-aminoadipate transaminase